MPPILVEEDRPPSLERPPPAGFVDLRAFIPELATDVRYHTADNFTGAPLPGYGAPGVWLREDAATALAQVQDNLAALGYGLLVYDAYRPRRASRAMVAWARRSEQTWVIDQGYVAPRSGHNKGNTIDLTLIDRVSGAPVDMGGSWDDFSAVSHVPNATGAAAMHRQVLRWAMMSAGWRPYSKEWWHFSRPSPHATPRDVPYGCFEANEGEWNPPSDWEQPGWAAPSTLPFDERWHTLCYRNR